jgi:type I restriction enzyme M protein
MIAAIYAAITLSKMRYLRSDPFRPDPGIQKCLVGVEACATVPPWGQRFDAFARLEKRQSRFGARTSEALGLELAALGPARESAVVVPNSLLAGRGLESELRRHLVENGPLKAVIGFPPNVLAGTSMPFSVLRLSRTTASWPVVFCKVDEKTHITGQGKIRSRDRRFVGADEILELLQRPDGELSRAVPRDEIIAQDFVLTPERYLSKSAPLLADMWKETAPLGDLVTIVKPQFLKPDEDPDGVKIQEAIPSEVPQFGYLERVDRIRTVDAKLLDVRSQQILRAHDVLLSTKGTIGTVGIAKPDGTRPALLPSQASVILRLKPGASALDPRFLVMYLRSPLVQKAIASFAVGGTIPNISLSDLKSLPVWLATGEEQQPFIEAFERQAALAKEISERSAEQQQIADQAWVNARLAVKE